MKLINLKQECYQLWEHINLEHGSLIGLPAWKLPEVDRPLLIYRHDFQAEIRKYGDLRRKETWIRAAIYLEAQSIAQCYSLDARFIVSWLHKPDTVISQLYPDRVLDLVLSYPQVLQTLKDGLEQLYYQPVEPSDRQNAIEFLRRLSEYEEIRLELPTLALAGSK